MSQCARRCRRSRRGAIGPPGQEARENGDGDSGDPARLSCAIGLSDGVALTVRRGAPTRAAGYRKEHDAWHTLLLQVLEVIAPQDPERWSPGAKQSRLEVPNSATILFGEMCVRSRSTLRLHFVAGELGLATIPMLATRWSPIWPGRAVRRGRSRSACGSG